VTAHRNDFPTPIRVINMSIDSAALDPGWPCDAGSPVFARAAAAAVASGIAVIAASGNGGNPDRMPYPACFSSVLAVGATYDASFGRAPKSGTYRDQFGAEFAACSDTTAPRAFACFTNRDACLALVAPGAAITSDYYG
jgi:subtilisin family serine protease